MTRRIMLAGLFLAVGMWRPAAAQPTVPVRDTRTVGVLEQLDIATRRALVPWSVNVAPLHAYDRELICSGDSERPALANHRGTAALVFAEASDDVGEALYHRSVGEAVRAAEEQFCPGTDTRNWYFATTYPLDEAAATRYFMSRDVEGIAALLATEADP